MSWREGFTVYPIGIVRTKYTEGEIKALWQQGVRGYIEVFPEYQDGLKDIQSFSHLFIIVWLHQRGEDGRRVLQVRHRKLLKHGVPLKELPLVGVFATDSPDRPNLLGLSIVNVEKVVENKIFVSNLDYYDGTPVLDIKPVTPDLMPSDIRVPDWYERLMKIILEKTGSPRL